MQILCLFNQNQTPRSDSANLEPSEPIFYPQILEPRFAECRDRTGDGCSPKEPVTPAQPPCVCMKRSATAGATWDSVPRCVAPAGSTQPLAVHHRGSGTTVLHFNLNGTVHQVTSTDGGQHWGAPGSLAAALGPGCAGANAGPGRGVQLSAAAGPHAGRLVMVGWDQKYPSPTRHDCVWHSDTAGANWTVSSTPLPMMNEAQVGFLSRLVLCGRTLNATGHSPVTLARCGESTFLFKERSVTVGRSRPS